MKKFLIIGFSILVLATTVSPSRAFDPNDFAKIKNCPNESCNLQGAYLSGPNLEKANLKGANLEGANLWRANLTSTPSLNFTPVNVISRN